MRHKSRVRPTYFYAFLGALLNPVKALKIVFRTRWKAQKGAWWV